MCVCECVCVCVCVRYLCADNHKCVSFIDEVTTMLSFLWLISMFSPVKLFFETRIFTKLLVMN